MASFNTENYDPEENLLNTLNDLDIGFVKVGNDGIILNHNFTFNKIFGYNPKKRLVGTKILNYRLNSKEWSKSRDIFHKESNIRKYLAPAKNIDGEKIFLQVNIKLNKDSDGEIISSEETFIDITEYKAKDVKLKESEEKLKNLTHKLEQEVEKRIQKLKVSEEKYRYFLENFQGIAYEGDLYFNTSFFHGNIEKITGYLEKKFLSREIKWDQLIFPDDLPNILENTKKIRTIPHYSAVQEFRIIRKDKKIAWIQEHFHNICDNQNKPIKVQGVLFDITESKKTEQKLKENEKKLLDAQRIASLGFWNWNLITNELYWSDETYRTFGFKPQEFIPSYEIFRKVVHPDDLEFVQKHVDNALLNDIRYNIDFRIVRPSNEIISVTAQGDVTRDANGKVISFVGTQTDITERKIAEQKLKESEEKFRTAVENSPDFIVFIKKDGTIFEVNRLARGFTRKMVIGQNIFSENFFEVKAHRENARKAINVSLESRETTQFESSQIAPDGSFAYFETKISPFRYNGEGRILSLQLTIRDITERKAKEKKLKASEERYRNFVENIQGIAFHGYQDFSLAFIDGRVEEITGYTSEDFRTGRIKWDQIIHPDDVSIIQKKVEIFHSSSAEIDSREYRIVQKDGKFRWVLEKNQKFYDNIKKKEGVQGIIVDITQRKKAENELIELNNLKSEFLIRASHELKTPLISIKGFSELILSLYADQLDPVITSKIREIYEGCRQLQNIVNNLLKTSRLQSLDLKPKVQKEDLSFLINFCFYELQSLADSRKQSIKLDIHKNLFANIEKEEIHDVISNLLTNAIKFTPPMGTIEIKSELHEDFVVISVNDNGIGFSEDQKKKIFQQFGKIERYGQGLDLGIDGTGLGLYISKRIVESHGGKIWMESEGENRGSTFYFTLPIVK